VWLVYDPRGLSGVMIARPEVAGVLQFELLKVWAYRNRTQIHIE
jgi:hypothetical protein